MNSWTDVNVMRTAWAPLQNVRQDTNQAWTYKLAGRSAPIRCQPARTIPSRLSIPARLSVYRSQFATGLASWCAFSMSAWAMDR